jgi:hypothetical protein
MDEFFRQMKERDEMLRRLAEGPAAEYLRNQEALARMSDLARTVDTNAIANALARLQTPEFAEALEQAARRASQIIDQFRTPEVLAAIDRAVAMQKQLSEVAERIVLAHDAAARRMQSMAIQIDATLKALPTIDFGRLGSLVAIAESRRATLAIITEKLVLRHTRLAETLAVAKNPLHAMPAPLKELPTRGLFVHTGAVRSITPHGSLSRADNEIAVSIRVEVSMTTSGFLEETLPALHAPYLDQYHAAKLRAVDRGPDWWTQGSASMRKLLKGVLHRAAPNELVLPWAQANNKPLDRVGRPTRATKIEWLGQLSPTVEYRSWVRAELESTLALIEIIDVAQHVDEFPEFEDKYNWIFLRVEVAVRLMLELWKLRGAH